MSTSSQFSLPYVPGVEVAVEESLLKRYRNIGLLTNDAARTSTGLHSRDYLLRNGITIKKLFAPEHGMNIRGADGAPQPHNTDIMTGLPIVSLYLQGTEVNMLDLTDLDLVLVDIPDVGARFYTYLWTMTHLMEACEKADIPMVVLDRPNPIGAVPQFAEGPMLDENNCSSFIGRWNIPVKHGCTIAELAGYFHQKKLPRLRLHLVAMKDYTRRLKAGIDYVFEPTSPALFRWQAVHLYSGMCFLEGINLSEGRGTPTPFEWLGAPWLEPGRLLAKFPQHMFPAIQMMEQSREPLEGLYAGQPCKGLSIALQAPFNNAVTFGLTLLRVIADTHPHLVQPRLYPTLANPGGDRHLDRLTGVSDFYDKLLRGENFETGVGDVWMEEVRESLLYLS